MSSATTPEHRPIQFGILGCATIARKVSRAEKILWCHICTMYDTA
jgi:hypothetical protein